MAVPSDEHERTIAFAEIALQQIRALRQAALPRNFEIWYQYATGYRSSTTPSTRRWRKKARLAIPTSTRFTPTIYRPTGGATASTSVGSRMMTEIKQVLDMIDTAAGPPTSYSASLADASEKLQGASDGASLRGVIERLVTGAKEMETNNKKLEARLRRRGRKSSNCTKTSKWCEARV